MSNDKMTRKVVGVALLAMGAGRVRLEVVSFSRDKHEHTSGCILKTSGDLRTTAVRLRSFAEFLELKSGKTGE